MKGSREKANEKEREHRLTKDPNGKDEKGLVVRQLRTLHTKSGTVLSGSNKP